MVSRTNRTTAREKAHAALAADFVRSYGATEVFPPEDADVIIDNTATGSTLEANGLRVVEVLMQSSTRLYANPRALEDATRPVPELFATAGIRFDFSAGTLLPLMDALREELEELPR